MIPINFPQTESRRLLRRNTGRATPLGDRKIITAEERARQREREARLEAMQTERLELGVGTNSDKNNQSSSETSAGEKLTGFSKNLSAGAATNGAARGGVSLNFVSRQPQPHVFGTETFTVDSRNRWMDTSHLSERRNTEKPDVRGDIQYDAATDRYLGTDKLSKASVTCGYTNAERVALRSLSETPQPKTEQYFSHSRSRQQHEIEIEGHLSGTKTPPPSSTSAISSTSISTTGGGEEDLPRLIHSRDNSQQQQHHQHQGKSFAEIYHERLKQVSEPEVSYSERYPELAQTHQSMRSHIADATINYFGQRHAPTAQQAAIQNHRSSAAEVLHGSSKNVAGHHEVFHDENVERNARKKTRAIHWKQEREDRLHSIADRREMVSAKEDMIANTKHERSMRRVMSVERDVDSFWKRTKGPKIVENSPARSSKSNVGNWLFSGYPVKQSDEHLMTPSRKV